MPDIDKRKSLLEKREAVIERIRKVAPQEVAELEIFDRLLEFSRAELSLS